MRASRRGVWVRSRCLRRESTSGGSHRRNCRLPSGAFVFGPRPMFWFLLRPAGKFDCAVCGGNVGPGWRATGPKTGGRPTRNTGGDQPKKWRGDYSKNWRAASPRTSGRPIRNWRATNPKTGGRPTRELAEEALFVFGRVARPQREWNKCAQTCGPEFSSLGKSSEPYGLSSFAFHLRWGSVARLEANRENLVKKSGACAR